MTKYTLKKDKIQIRKAIFKKIHSKVGNLSSAKYRVFFNNLYFQKGAYRRKSGDCKLGDQRSGDKLIGDHLSMVTDFLGQFVHWDLIVWG